MSEVVAANETIGRESLAQLRPVASKNLAFAAMAARIKKRAPKDLGPSAALPVGFNARPSDLVTAGRWGCGALVSVVSGMCIGVLITFTVSGVNSRLSAQRAWLKWQPDEERLGA